MIAAFTGMGLSAAAGLNAFIPLVIVGALARFTDFVSLPSQLDWLSSWPAIIVSLLLLLAELILDKIPGVDHINDLLQSAIRPLVGGVIFAASAAAADLDQGAFWSENPLWGGIAGAIVAALVHAGKSASRPAINAATGGTGAPVASFAEDATAVGLSFIAIFIPVMVVAVLICVGIAVYRIVTTGRRRRRNREIRQTQQRLEREAASARGEKVSWWRSHVKERNGAS